MLKRRDFLRGFIGVGVSLGINPVSVLAVVKKNYGKETGELKELAWIKTIFCCFENPALKARIEECARELNCEVFWGDPASPDIIAIPYFIAIIDRRPFSIRQIIDYCEFCRETDDATPLLIVDGIRLNDNIFLPKLKDKLVLQFDPVDKAAIEQIVKFIRLERARVLANWRKW